ncbi:MAG: hypothetical protein FD167_2510 [bacterium]|nr:MAG: hypothetical protein FD167_2510 [bacterium]
MVQLKRSLVWLNALLTASQPSSLTTKKLFVLCFTIFFLALGVKLLYWQDQAGSTVNNFHALAYDTEAENILAGKGILFPNQTPKSGNAKLLVHPPGYSILVAISFTLFGNSLLPLSFIHQFFDSLAVVVIFLIGLELFPLGLATIGALLALFSPHFAYYGLNVSPESPTNLLLLLATFFLIKTIKNFQLKSVFFVGILIGLSCWLRPNALMLSPFLAILLPFLEAKDRVRYVIILVLATVIIISPITIRNLIVFKQFIPISIGVGANLIEGIADYDLENKFGFPAYDQGVAQADVKIYNRPDYAGNQWSPDGLMREKNRTKRAMEAIKSNPIWFLGVMLKRVVFMLSYNDKGSARWPLNTAIVPIVAAEASFGHLVTETGKPTWSIDPASLAGQGKTLTPQANTSFQAETNELVIIGDNSSYNDQFSSPIIPLTPYTDYVLTLKLTQQGQSAIKITSSDERSILAIQIVRGERLQPDTNKNTISVPLSDKSNVFNKQLALENKLVKIPFASGPRNEIKILWSNDGTSLPQTSIEQIELSQIGATPYTWTKPFRVLIHGIQKNVYNTKFLLPLLLIGVFLLILAKQKQTLALLLIIPVYYFCFQSILHTEYRYIYVIHYFLLLISATTTYFLVNMLGVSVIMCKNKLINKK